MNHFSLPSSPAYFAKDLDPVDLKFVPDNTLIVAGRDEVQVYDIDSDFPELRCTIHPDAAVGNVLPGPKRNQCTLLLEHGEMVVYEIGD